MVVFNITDPSTARISRISGNGEVTVEFSESMVIPENYEKIDKNILLVWLRNVN